MAAKTYVNEGSTSDHSISFFDSGGVAVTPESLRYRVTDGSVDVVPWAILANNATEIEISATANTIGTVSNKRYLTVEATHNGGDKITSEIVYTLANLKGIP